MHVVVRKYTGAPQAADELERRHQEVENLIGGVPGLRAYYLFRTANGITSVTACDQKAGTDESVRLAAAWIRENLAAGSFSAPEITEGETFIHLGG